MNFHEFQLWHTAQSASWTQKRVLLILADAALNRLIAFQRITPTPYNSTLAVVCVVSVYAHFVLVYEPNRMTSAPWAFQSPWMCPAKCFTVSVTSFFNLFFYFGVFLNFNSNCICVFLDSPLNSSIPYWPQSFVLHLDLNDFPDVDLPFQGRIWNWLFFPLHQFTLWVLHFIFTVYSNAVACLLTTAEWSCVNTSLVLKVLRRVWRTVTAVKCLSMLCQSDVQCLCRVNHKCNVFIALYSVNIVTYHFSFFHFWQVQ